MINVNGKTITYGYDYDFWASGKNINGTIGAIANTTINYDGTLKGGYGYSVSPIIPKATFLSVKVHGEFDKISAFYYHADGSYAGKNTSIQGDVVATDAYGDYCLITLQNPKNVAIHVIKPERPLDVDNPYVHAYMQNVHYKFSDFAQSLYPPYGIEGIKNRRMMTGAKPVYVEVPVTEQDGCVVTISENVDYSDAQLVNVDVYRPYVAVDNLKTDTLYWVKIVGKDTTAFQLKTGGLERFVSISGVSNFRDIGGKSGRFGKIRQGIIYRSAHWDGIKEAGVNEVKRLGITTEIDFRGSNDTMSPTYTPPVEYLNIETGSIQAIATDVPDMGALAIFRAVLERIEQGKAVCFHCKGGADRTGKMGAVMGGLLGMSQSELSKDYELTCFSEGATNGRVDDLEDDGHWWSEAMLNVETKPGSTTTAKWEYICKSWGMTDDEIYRFRRVMLQDYG